MFVMENNSANPNQQPLVSQPSNHFSKTFIILLVLLIAAVGVGGYFLGARKSASPQNVACTLDALLCPDGSSVGRVPPSCEFAPCPTVAPDETANWKIYESSTFSLKYPPAWPTPIVNQQSTTKEYLFPSSNFTIREGTRYSQSLNRALTYQEIIAEQEKAAVGSQQVTVADIATKKYINKLGASSWEQTIILQPKNSKVIYWISVPVPATTDETIFDKILATFRFVEKKKLKTSCINEPDGVPIITSISANFGPKGTKIEIIGCNLAGFEGDLDAIFVRSDGAKIPLFGGLWHSSYGYTEEERGKLMRITVQSYCESGYETGRYSGIRSSCKKVEATPGVYKVYVTAWGKNSNEVNFTITE